MGRTVLAGGLVVDGSGAPPFVGDVVWEGDAIVDVGPAAERHPGAEVIGADGLVVAPGFIDAHSHGDNAPFLAEDDLSKLTQGVTTEIVGNCGMSLAPRSQRHGGELDRYLARFFPPRTWPADTFRQWAEAADRRGYVVNALPLVGHGTLRLAVMGFENRAPSAREMASMRSHLEEALDAGSGGLSSGLIYPPGRYADTAELIALARGLSGRPALYASHMRSEGAGLLDAVRETLRIGAEAGVAVEISHLKAIGQENWGNVDAALGLVQAARGAGQSVAQDVYPYTASSTALAMALPSHLSGLSDADLLARLAEPTIEEEVRSALADDPRDRPDPEGRSRYERIVVSWTRDHRHEGKTLAEIGQALGSDGVGALVEVLRGAGLQASMVSFGMTENDLRRALADPFTCIGSDGLPPGMGGKPHPRLWGTFPRILSRYVREEGLLSLAEAIRRMTALPAAVFHLASVGRLGAGLRADIVAFDPGCVADRATYADPVQAAAGIRHVFVGGGWALRHGVPAPARTGIRLRPRL